MTDLPERWEDGMHDALIQAYLDGETSPDEEAEVRRLLCEPSFCRRLAEYATDAGYLRELGREGLLYSKLIPRASGRSESPTCEDAPRLAAESSAPEADRSLRMASAPVVSRWRRLRRALALATAATIFAVAAVRLFHRLWDEPVVSRAALGRIIRKEGPVVLEFGGARQSHETVVHDGDSVRTGDLGGFAVTELVEGTILVLSDNTRVTLEERHGQRTVFLAAGHLNAQVRPQPPARPLAIVTPLARIEVLGTSLAVGSDVRKTEVGVREGRVRIERLSDGQSLELSGGDYAVASHHVELRARALPPIADCWLEDFENGLPDQWRYGQWVSEGLPDGSRGAVRASRWSILEGRESNSFRITTPKLWASGLCRIGSDTVLHFTYKMERPGWFHIMMGTRGDDLIPGYVGNYEAQRHSWYQLAAGQWATVSIPLAEFSRAAGQRTPPDSQASSPRPGDVVYMIWFSTADEDRGLTIDRIWITREGNPQRQPTPAGAAM